MFTHVKNAHVPVLLGLLCVSTGPLFGADQRPIDSALPVLTPDDPTSVAAIDGPWGEPIYVRVITLSDVPVASVLVGSRRDPSAPARMATTILAPTGEPVHLNIVELGRRVARRGSRKTVEWSVNTDLPFTTAAELAAALQGTSIVRLGDVTTGRRAEPVCYVTGEAVVELFVWYDPETDRTADPNYGVQIVPPDGDGGPGTVGAASNSNQGDELGDGLDDGGPPDDGDGADPIGSPDLTPGRG